MFYYGMGTDEWPSYRAKECPHSEDGHCFVNVSFMQLKYVCKHCDAPAPEGWRPE